MKSIKNKTVADIVTQNIHTAIIFEKYGIDYSYKGKTTIKKACSKNGVDYTLLEKELKNLHHKTNFLNDFNKWRLDFLMIFITHNHHIYVRKMIPNLIEYGEKAAKIQGENHKELEEINSLFFNFSKKLMVHIIKEETIVFPFIKNLLKANKEHTSIEASNFNYINQSILLMEENHVEARDIFKRISKLSNKYCPPKNACKAFKKLYKKLQEFEDNMNKHVHLENNILFPKAKKLKLKVLNN